MRISSIPLHLRRLLLGTTALTGLALAAAPAAEAQGLPTGGTVTAGTANIALAAANHLAVTTGGQRTVIDWQSFSIANGNKVTIQQPGMNSVTVNEVTGATPSQIFGDLSSNGRVVLANPNGIWFGPDSHVDVAGLVASTATMTNAAAKSFAAGGRLSLDQAGSATASIVNDGRITIANQGLAALVAPGVRNNGVITATLGQVTLASGTTATLDFYGDGLVSMAVTSPVTALAIGPDGKPFKATIENNGTLAADGGHVLVTANVVKGVVDNVINMSGVTEAKAVSVAGGDIVLDGGDGAVTVTGTLNASGTKAGQTGGTVAVTGGAVTLAATAKLDASGAAGGGTVQIGGGPHGGGALHYAQSTLVMGGALINANATRSGTGGTVSIWSDQATRFDGTILAQGAGTGTGGWVETSSKGELGVGADARVDTAAPGGKFGSWLLDPTNLFIVTGGSDASHIDPTSFEFSASNVTLSATSNLTVSSEIDMSQAGLTLTAGHALSINAPIHLNAPGALALTGDTSVNIGADISTASGAITVQTGLGGTIDIGGGTHVTAAGPLSIFVDNTTTLSTTDGAQITIGGSITADGIYIKATDQAFNQANGFIEIQPSAVLTNTGASVTSTDVNHADLILFAGYGGALQIDSGATIVANAGNIALLADTLTIADSPANIATPAALIISPASSLGYLSASNPSYNDFTGGAFSGTQSVLTGVLPGGVTPVTIGVGTDTEAFSVPQSTVDALNGTGAAGTIDHIQIGLAGGNPTNISGTVSALNGLSIQGAVTLTGDTSLSATGAIAFGGTIDGQSAGGQSLTLSAPTGAVTFAGAVGGGTSLNRLDVSAVTVSLPASVHTASDQSYSGAATVGATTGLTSDNGGITFFGTLQGNDAVTVSAVNGVATFEDVVGGLTPSTELHTFTVTASSINLTSVNSDSTQTYNGPVTLSGNVTFNSGSGAVVFGNTVNGAGSLGVVGAVSFGGSVTTGGSQSYSGAATLTGNATLTASGGITLGTVDGAHALALSDTTVGDTVSVGAIGGGTALNSLSFTGANISLSSVQTTGAQNYAGPVTLAGNGSFQSTGGTITFGNTVNGAGTLGVTAANGIVLQNTVTTSGAQTYTGPVTLAADTTVDSTGSSIQFTSTVDGTSLHAQSLTVEAATTAEFDGTIGGITALNRFSLTASSLAGGGGVSNVNALVQSYDIGSGLTLTGTVTINGFEDSGPIILSGDTTINAGSGGINISGSVDGAHALTLIDTASSVALTGPVGQSTPLTTLALTGAGGISLGSLVTTSGAQTYNSAVTLASSTTLTASTVTFASTVTDTLGNALSVNAPGGIIFGGAVTTLGDQTYADPVTIAGNVTFQSTGGSVTFDNTIDGATAGGQSLTLAAAGNVNISGAIGGTAALASFQTSGNTVLQASTTITTAGGAITFGGRLDNLVARSGSLVLNAGGGDVTFNDLVGNIAALGAVTISQAGNVTGPALNASSLASGVNEFRARSLTVGGSGPITGSFTMLGGISVVPGNNQTGATTAGTIFIDAAGAVTIGTNNSSNPNADLGVFARGADITTSSTAIAGNGGAITIIGSSLTLSAASVRGGEVESGNSVAAAGGNGGTLSLTATSGGITIVGGLNDDGLSASGGWSTNGAAGGNAGSIAVNAPGAFSVNYVTVDGGAATSGAGGNAGTATINASTIAVDRVRARGGDTASTSAAGGAGGSITMIATGTAANVITITGNASDFSGSATAINYGTLSVRGGDSGVSDALTTDVVPGTIAGSGGSLLIEGSNSGGALHGAIALVNGGVGAGPTATTAYQGGPDILISAAGTAGHGGTVTILGSITAADNGVENLQLGGANSTTTISGNIGSAANPLGSLVLNGNGSGISVGGSVNTNAVVEQRTTGSFTVAGTLSTLSYISPITNTVSLDLNSLFSSSGNVSLAGSYLLTSGGNFSSDSLTLAGTTIISTPNGASALTIGSVDGPFGLTLNAGTDAVAFTAIGSKTALGSLVINAGSISLGSVATTGAQTYTGGLTVGGTYTANGFTTSGAVVMAGNTTINGGTGDITLGGTVNGPFALALVSSNANIFFDGSVGTTAARVPSLSITGANNATVQNNSSLQVDRFTATNVAGTIDFGNHSLESDDIVAIQATSVEGRIITTSSATINAGTVSGTIQGSAVSVTASGAVNASVTADTANISSDSFSGSVQATRSANIAANDISASVGVSSGGATLSGANISGSVTSSGLAQIAASQTLADNITAGGVTITGTAAITGNITSTGGNAINITAKSLNGNVDAQGNGSVAITASQFIVGTVIGGDVSLTAPFIDVNVTALEVTFNTPNRNFPTDITQVVSGSTNQVASNDQNTDLGNLTGPSSDDDDKKKKRHIDPVYDFANQYIDNLIAGKTVH